MAASAPAVDVAVPEEAVMETPLATAPLDLSSRRHQEDALPAVPGGALEARPAPALPTQEAAARTPHSNIAASMP